MRIALFALTGFGNPILRALKYLGAEVKLVATRQETGPNPYYPERDFTEEATEMGFSVMTSLPTPSQLNQLRLDVLLTATYHRILTAEHIDAAPLALNLHPSLLPKYRGASPIFWAIRNGEKQTGLSLHELTTQVDQGRLWAQMSVDILPSETQGSLRKKLADASGTFLRKNLPAILENLVEPVEQDEKKATHYPRFDRDIHSQLDLQQTWEEVERHFRALYPWPGTYVNGHLITTLEELRNYHTGA